MLFSKTRISVSFSQPGYIRGSETFCGENIIALSLFLASAYAPLAFKYYIHFGVWQAESPENHGHFLASNIECDIYGIAGCVALPSLSS